MEPPYPASNSILIVNNCPYDFDRIETTLRNQGYQFYYATTSNQVRQQLSTTNLDLIIIDAIIQEKIKFCREIKAHPSGQNLPILMVAAEGESHYLASYQQAGMDEFIITPFCDLELQIRVASLLEVNRQKDQSQIDLEAQVQERTRQIENMIYLNPLTGLPSRGYLLQIIRKQLNAKQNFALLCFDCDEFQGINNCFGYEIGDALLLAIRDRVNVALGANDILAHLEEDNFCIFVSNVENKSQLERLRQIIFDSFSHPFWVEDQELFVTISMGIVDCRSHNTSAILALRQVRTALHWAKKKGKERWLFFQEEMFQAIGRKLQLVRDLRRGIEKDEFIVYYQPIIDIKQNRVSGFEALIRWQHPQEGLISPGEFIPYLEETGLIIPVGMIVLEKACFQLKQLQDYGFSDLTMSVNLSAVQFTNPNLLADIELVLNKTQINPACLKLEITESVVMDNPTTTVKLLEAFQEGGIQLSIDDFGTGYSSLSYLQQFPVDNLKIDRAFVGLLEVADQNLDIIRAIVQLGQVLGMTITAEGIEKVSHLEILKKLGCEYGQGYWFAKPMPAEAVFSYLGLTEKSTSL